MRTSLEDSSDRSKEIDEMKIRIADTLSIVTSHNIYTFSVIDPVQLYGMVVGGVIGPCPREGFLSRSSLKVGSRARVMIRSFGGYRFITTSMIRFVAHWKEDGDTNTCGKEERT